MTTASETVHMIDRLHAYETLLDAIATAPRERPYVTTWHPDQDPEFETFTFGQFLDLAQRFATLYRDHGVEPRDTVVLIMPQGVPLMAGFVGAMLLGAIPTILAYPTFKIDPEKYQHGLSGVTRNIEARIVVLDRDFPPELLGHIATHGDTRVVQVDERTFEPFGERLAWADPSPDDVAFIQHSAGTTGLQKGVALPHRAVLNQLEHLAAAIRLTHQDRIVNWLPLYHDMGLIACFILPLACHLHVVMQSPTDWVLRPGSMLRLVTKYKCTLCWLPNFAFQFMARRVPLEERRSLDFSSMRAMINCSEPVRAQSMEEFYQSYHSSGLSRSALQSSYAMAENTFAVTQSTFDGESSPPTIWVERDLFWDQGRVEIVPPGHPTAVSFVSSGKCLAANAVRVVADDGTILPEGRVGEILVHSDSLFQGYYDRPDLTSKALRDGWYRTEDVGFLLDSEVYVIGRKDDTIIVGGKNLYPQDIEEIAFSHPDIHDGRAVAFGLYNPDLGTQDLVVIAEVNHKRDLEQRQKIEVEIRRAVLGEIGVAPRIVHLVPPKWTVKSTAGKPARSTNRRKFLREHPELDYDDTERHKGRWTPEQDR